MDTSDIFKFFLLGEVEGGVRGAGKRDCFAIEIPRGEGGGGFSRRGRGRGAGKVSAANWGIGGGAKYFFRGRNVHQEKIRT